MYSERHEIDRGNILVKRRHWLAEFALTMCSGWASFTSRGIFAAAAPGTAADSGAATHFLPLFPLGIVAFPGQQVLLQIFEPRYKQLMAESAETGNSFGIVTVVTGGASSVGTEMLLDSVLYTEDNGNMVVATRGLHVFQLKRFQRDVEGKLYSGGQVAYMRNDPGFDPEIQNALAQRFNRMPYRGETRQVIAAPYPQNLSFLIGHDLGLTLAQELQLLTMAAERDRQTYLLRHLLRAQ